MVRWGQKQARLGNGQKKMPSALTLPKGHALTATPMHMPLRVLVSYPPYPRKQNATYADQALLLCVCVCVRVSKVDRF